MKGRVHESEDTDSSHAPEQQRKAGVVGVKDYLTPAERSYGAKETKVSVK